MLRFHRLFALAALLVPAALIVLPTASADNNGGGNPTITRVEEDWELIVAQPNTQTSSPQLSTQMTSGSNAGLACNVNVNFQDYPQYAPGGVQIYAWQNSNLVNVQGAPVNWSIENANETITWTQYLQTGATPTFGFRNFASISWGNNPSTASISLTGINLVLDNYSPTTSVSNSAISLGSNRVTSFTLKCVRKYYSDGSTTTDNTGWVVYPAQ